MGITLKDEVKNEEIRRRPVVEDILEIISVQNGNGQWTCGEVERIKYNALVVYIIM